MINRAKAQVPVLTRAALKPNSIFQYMKDGKASGDHFANFGKGDKLSKFFSIALEGKNEGKLCSSSKGTQPVALTGTWEVEVDLVAKGREKKVARNTLTSGDVFQVPGSKLAKKTGKPSLYVHLGHVDNDRKVLSFNLNTKALCIGTKLNGSVAKTGNTNVITTMAA